MHRVSAMSRDGGQPGTAASRAFTPLEERLDEWAHRLSQALAADAGPWRRGLLEFAVFTAKQAWACVFGAAMLTLLVLARLL